MVFVLDTDTFSLAARGNEAVAARIAEYDGLVYLSAVAVREALKGAIAAVADAESPNPRFPHISVPDAYDLLLGIVEQIGRYPTLPYTDAAEAIWAQLPKSVQRMAPRDCRIAANAVASGMIVVTANTRHFEQIAETLPDLRIVNWRL